MNKSSSNTMLWVLGGAAVLYVLSKQSTAAIPAVSGQNMATQTGGTNACPSSFLQCCLSPTICSVLSMF